MNPNMMPLPYYGGPPPQMQRMPYYGNAPSNDMMMLMPYQHPSLTPDQVWPFAHPGKSGAPDLPDEKKKKEQQKQQQQKGGLGMSQLGMNMLYPGGAGAGGFPYGMSPQMWSSMGQGVTSPWGQS